MSDRVYSQSPAALEARARRVARREGLRAIKSTWRKNSWDNQGGFMLVDDRNIVQDGARYELSAEEVIDFCTQ